MSSTVFSRHGEIWIQRQRRRGQPDLFCAWRPHCSQLFEDPEELIAFFCGEGPLPSDTLADLQAWLGQTLEEVDPAELQARQQAGSVVL